MNKEYIGSSFDDFLEEEGIAKEVKKKVKTLEIPISLDKEKAKVRIPVDKVIDNINTYGARSWLLHTEIIHKNNLFNNLMKC